MTDNLLIQKTIEAELISLLFINQFFITILTKLFGSKTMKHSYRYKVNLLKKHQIPVWRNQDCIQRYIPDGVTSAVVVLHEINECSNISFC